MSTLAETTPSLARAADIILAHDLSIVPVANLKDKRPGPGPWKRYMKEPAQPTEARSWFVANGHPAAEGIGIVCGAVSGGLTVIDFDIDGCGNSRFHAWCALVEQADEKLLNELPTVQTPSGGFHVYARADTCPGNQKLAMTADGRVLIETRGEGGYVVAPPSPGYRTIVSSVHSAPTLDDEALAFLLHCARSLDERTESQPEHGQAPPSLPMDDATLRSLLDEPLSLLIKHGWSVAGRGGDKLLMRRPGKDGGNSATLGHWEGVPVFYAFSTNVEGVPVGEALNIFKLYAHLEHGGDFAAARRALAPKPGPDVRQVEGGGTVGTEAPKPALPRTVTDAELDGKDIPAPRWAVPGLFMEGSTLLIGPPKAGKSFMLMDLALSIRDGERFADFATCEAGEVLYLCLEDGEGIAQRRMRRLSPDTNGRLHFAFEWPKDDQGAVEYLDRWLTEHPHVRLVLIDTLARWRGSTRPGKGVYEQDIAATAAITDVAKKHRCSAIIAHHTRKSEATDWVEKVSGSNGLAGGVDSVAVLVRPRGEEEGKLCITGREIEERELACRFDRESLRWTIEGDYEQVRTSDLESRILECLADAGGPMGAPAIAAHIGNDSAESVRVRLHKVLALGKVRRSERGLYSLPSVPTVPTVQRTIDTPDQGTEPTAAPAEPAPGADAVSLYGCTVGTDTDCRRPPEPPPGAVQGVLLATSCVACGAGFKPWRELSDGQEPFCRKCWRKPGAGKRRAPTGSA